MLQNNFTWLLTFTALFQNCITESAINTYTIQPYFPRSEVYYGRAIPPSQSFDVSYSYGRSVLLVPIILLGVAIIVSQITCLFK